MMPLISFISFPRKPLVSLFICRGLPGVNPGFLCNDFVDLIDLGPHNHLVLPC